MPATAERAASTRVEGEIALFRLPHGVVRVGEGVKVCAEGLQASILSNQAQNRGEGASTTSADLLASSTLPPPLNMLPDELLGLKRVTRASADPSTTLASLPEAHLAVLSLRADLDVLVRQRAYHAFLDRLAVRDSCKDLLGASA